MSQVDAGRYSASLHLVNLLNLRYVNVMRIPITNNPVSQSIQIPATYFNQ